MPQLHSCEHTVEGAARRGGTGTGANPAADTDGADLQADAAGRLMMTTIRPDGGTTEMSI